MQRGEHAPSCAGTSPQNGAAGSAPRHMTPCVCHCAACRAAGHGNKCVVLRMGLLRLFDNQADVVDLVLRHYHGGASGWDMAGFEKPVVSMQYGPAGDVIAAGDSSGRIHLICTQTGAKFFCLEGHSDFVRCVQFSTDAKQLVSGSDDKTVRLWDVGSGKQLKQFFGHSAPINDVRFSSDDTMLVSCSGHPHDNDNSVRLWDVETGKELKKLEGHSKDNKDCTCEFYHWGKKANPACSVQGHSGRVFACEFAPDAKTIVSGSEDETLKIWNVASGTCQATLEGHSEYVICLQFNPTNPRQLVSGSADKTIRLWDVDSGKELKKLEGHSAQINGVRFSLDGTMLASCSGGYRQDDNSVRLWDVGS